MPLTPKGQEIESALVKEYGKSKGENVLYAGKNSGRFTGIDSMITRDAKVTAIADAFDGVSRKVDALGKRVDAEDKTKISKSSLATKLESSTMSMLESAWRNADTDPAVKKMIEKEMDSRANRGSSKGFGEK